MKSFFDDDCGQLILIACVSVVFAIVLMATYEYSTLGTGETSINRENKDSFYYYDSIRDRFTAVYSDPILGSPTNITIFEKELKEFALLHGYSADFMSNNTQATIIFMDKDLRIEEVVTK